MANDYFKFKEFTLSQKNCGMKITSDACLFGAFIAKNFEANKVLDIGAGTGLLSLMYAQQNQHSLIDAVEIEEEASFQANLNVIDSPWKNSIKLHNLPIQKFCPENKKNYDLIFSNPPFFDSHLKSTAEKRNKAFHNDHLPFDELFASVDLLLKDQGDFLVLIPIVHEKDFEDLSKKYQFSIKQKIELSTTPTKQVRLIIFHFSKSPRNSEYSTFRINTHNTDGEYSTEYKKILHRYYIFL